MKLDALTALGFVTTRSAAAPSSAVTGAASPAYPPNAQPMPVGTRLTTTARPVGGGGTTGPSGAAGNPIHSVTSTWIAVASAALTYQRNGSPVTASATAAATPPGAATEDGANVYLRFTTMVGSFRRCDVTRLSSR